MNILKRENLINDLLDHQSEGTVKLITGVRASGKTTLIKSMMSELIENGYDEENVVYISFLSPEYYLKKNNEVINSIKDTLKNLNGNVYLFFDNVEVFEDWQAILDYFRKYHDCRIFAAVNYSKFYKLGVPHLAGRSSSFELYPFSFKEFVQYNEEFGDVRKSTDELFNEYLRYGGMPDVVSQKHEFKSIFLDSICQWIRYSEFNQEEGLESYLIDIFLRHVVETNTETFDENLLKKCHYGIFDDQKILKLKSLADKSSFLLNSYKSFDKYRFKTFEKYYLVDHSFFIKFNCFHNISPDVVLRNIVFVELLRRGYKVFFTDKHEQYVDFICKRGNKSIFIQFDYIFANESIIKKECDFLKHYAKDDDKYIITTGNYGLTGYGVKHLNVIDFLLGDEI